jgi:hypothetical protein
MIRDYHDDELGDSVVLPASVQKAVRKSCLDQTFKNQLLDHPTATLRTEGFDMPSGVEVEVLEDTDEVLYLILPFNAISTTAELSDSELASVVGGGRKTATAMSTYS